VFDDAASRTRRNGDCSSLGFLYAQPAQSSVRWRTQARPRRHGAEHRAPRLQADARRDKGCRADLTVHGV